MRLTKTAALAALLSTTMLMPAWAADLTIGRASEQSSIDPQFSRTGNNQMTSTMFFDRLVNFDENLQVSPGLAESWTNEDETTWTLKLREGVTFHDGSPFTAADVVYSLERADEVPNSPAPYTDMVSSVASVEAVDDLTVKITTNVPNPALMEDIGRVFIISKAAAEGKTSEDFNAPATAVGTGPYILDEWRVGETLTMHANEAYWGTVPEFNEVEIRFISNDAARVAALLSGAVDVIDAVPPQDVTRLEGTDGINVFSTPSGRVIYLGLSMRGDQAPAVTDLAGNPLEENPFKDARVRKAISLMIDRQLIVDRILGGSGVPAGQLVPDALGGHNPDVAPDAVDVEQAKALLAEAGYPDGFGLTLYSSNDRFPGDGDIVQALGQMLARGGLKVNGVEALPYSVYSKAASAGDYGAFVFSLGSSTPTSAPNLQALLGTYDKEAGKGAFNRVRFSSEAFDAALADALQEFDEEARLTKLRDATALVFEETPIVPLYWQKVHWGLKDGLTIDAGLSEQTLPQKITSTE
ncbi:ABC transporter substrate-binding protein [Ponticoccus alexandrii]|uniref:ABC transporter substrate-binding protein n=1 Tax=Ponticoccus alexandrii TaxID=1943633 RepID=A0ABX7FHT8_9RHOB|nr:ABC transporter substrate-binding protein [Ponticoccus alexandrii]ETA53419.1 ABC transporter substrate-binding protein [Rhodobacteraceae bacterium PD-2]QRF69233.1 ABC transporter substrate-binding protein [Ponticoccus alexandrii]